MTAITGANNWKPANGEDGGGFSFQVGVMEAERKGTILEVLEEQSANPLPNVPIVHVLTENEPETEKPAS